MRRLAIEMHSLGLVNESDAKPWTDDEEAGKALGVPTFIARMMGTQRYAILIFTIHDQRG